MQQTFQNISIPKLPVFTTEEGIKLIRKNLNTISDWKNIFELIPKFYSSNKMKRTGIAGIFAASLELTKDGDIAATEDNVSLTNVGSILPKFQYKDPSGKLMMLPSDIVLIEDSEFKQYVQLYAKNQKLLDIYSEVTSNGWNTILEDELKTESEYNCMVYFRI